MRKIIAIILLVLALGDVLAVAAAGNAPDAFDFPLFLTHTE